MCRAAPSAHGSQPAKNQHSRNNPGIMRKTPNWPAGTPRSNVQHPRNRPEGIPHRPGGARWEAGPARIPREAAPPHRSPAPRRRSGEKDSLSLSHQKGLGGGVGHLPRPPRRDVHFALENNGWSCTFECEAHVWAPETSGGVGRVGAAARGIAGVLVTAAAQPAAAPGEGAWRRRLSKSVAKTRVAPKRARRNVGIPRFFSRPIPARSAFAADLDTSPSQDRPRSPTRTIAGESSRRRSRARSAWPHPLHCG